MLEGSSYLSRAEGTCVSEYQWFLTALAVKACVPGRRNCWNTQEEEEGQKQVRAR